MTEIIWRTEAIKSMLTGKHPLVTKEAARISNEAFYYSSSKIIGATGFQFTPLQKCLQETASIFLNDLKQGQVH
jgi:hypothetical protein